MTTSEFLTEEWLKGALTRLGDNADRVAETLRTYRAASDRCGPPDCPIARYLHAAIAQELPGDAQVRVSVGPGAVLLDTKESSGNVHSVGVTTPYPVAAFIEAFDRGEPAYADLDAHAAPAST